MNMYSYDRRTAAIQEKIFTDPTGKPTGPNTPWGKADGVREIMRGVRWVNTPGHGGLGVAKGVADKLLTSAARRLGNYLAGYFWYEEDQQCEIPFFEHPEWAHALGHAGTKESYEEAVKSHYPKYFEMLSDGTKDPPKLKPGMKLKFLVPMKFGGGWDFNEGTVVEVVNTTASSIVFTQLHNKNVKFKLPMGAYYGHGYDAQRQLEAVE
jgi:hypothetical protein